MLAELHAIGFDFASEAEATETVEALFDPTDIYPWTEHDETIRVYTDPSGARLVHVIMWPGMPYERSHLFPAVVADTGVRLYLEQAAGLSSSDDWDWTSLISDSGFWVRTGRRAPRYRVYLDDFRDDCTYPDRCLVWDDRRSLILYGLATTADVFPSVSACTSAGFVPGTLLGRHDRPTATVSGEVIRCEPLVNDLTGVPWFRVVLDTSPRITVAVAGDVSPAPETGKYLCGQITVGVTGGTWDTGIPARWAGSP